jgi:hypothetical protein
LLLLLLRRKDSFVLSGDENKHGGQAGIRNPSRVAGVASLGAKALVGPGSGGEDF